MKRASKNMEHAEPAPLGLKTTNEEFADIFCKNAKDITPPDILSGFVQIDELRTLN